ncbi:MAG: hypothetical protein COW19_02670 [Zetaproteobacteria bacterium CG12_big_fil_rev_8_21_14_0_65_55_1124]|nr:MAG: hypothetical protein AUJ58_08355 [Zetaproteobacteria bacterium CG1_02_55_237]PIS19723.1 MAG: hypothetical protein COT53_04175 [Zetaproteobacteria bacterium CG08_land_8_20_14_0_20_55_17]PIW43489.1 MAG: hypothetical protein COW19_02670 [Zetaproteobacteria bacterium CG12_big_fil_rev_8_21_14_0_65_55_1124]PIY54121.1 MAG: hypothetical protein COZ01_01450 [Zetaproteobacteria bacterium CG_4_10_14_0_8_um_filter_55_43]PIZ39114.1 MAG: hypothetical protein COY36_03930 [Zetaproteobacteria bacterium 
MNNPSPPLIQAMLREDFYQHPVEEVRLLQTHASWVLLTGSFAYKVKKPVNFGFLDFSTLDKRHHFCEEELHLNRRLAPKLYLDILPIGYEDGSFKLGGTKDIRDYCVKMRQFADSDLLSERINNTAFDTAWMDVLARNIANFHAQATQNDAINTFGAPRYLLSHIDASLNTALHHPEAIKAELIHDLRRLCMQQTKHLVDIFAQRIADARIRDCHGDLHLGNIALYDGKPTVFDCIEFNPEYRAIDTLNDAAFLVMDCDARGHADLAFRFLSRYLEFSGDYSGMPLLPLFLSYRAGVRGKVACLLAEDAATGKNEKQTKLEEAARYFELAATYLKPSTTPCLYAVGGLSGSGKSHLALLGCGIARAIIIRSDATRKRIAGIHLELDLYSEEMHRHTYQAMFDAAITLLSTGWPVILDATFLSMDERQRARNTANASGVPFRFAWIDASEDKLKEHIHRRMQKGANISDADIPVLEMQLTHYHRPEEQDIHFLPSANAWPWT